MLVHRRVTPSINFAGTHLYIWVERGTVRVKCLAQEQECTRPGLEPGPLDPETSTLTMRSMRPPWGLCFIFWPKFTPQYFLSTFRYLPIPRAWQISWAELAQLAKLLRCAEIAKFLLRKKRGKVTQEICQARWIVVSFAAVFRLVTQRSSPQTLVGRSVAWRA